MKTITLPIQVPEWAEWRAQNNDGSWWVFDICPVPRKSYWDELDCQCEEVVTANEPNPNWRDTLRRIDE